MTPFIQNSRKSNRIEKDRKHMGLRVKEREKYCKGTEEISSVMCVYFLDSGDGLLGCVKRYVHIHARLCQNVSNCILKYVQFLIYHF